MERAWRGIFAIPATPFHDDLTLDFVSLERQIDFCLASGVHGLVYPVMASEFYTLDDEERFRAVEAVLRQVNHRVPVIVGVTGVNVHHSLRLAIHAQSAGADGVIAMTPVLSGLSENDAVEFYQRLDDALDIPIFVQNASAYGMSALSVEPVLRLARDCKHVRYVKEEAPPSLHRIERLVHAGSGVLDGVFGGAGGLMLLEELERGASGNMPSSAFCATLARVFDLWSIGQKQQATLLFQRLLPGLVMANHFGLAFSKAVLVEQGIISNGKLRSAAVRLSESDYRFIRRFLGELGE